MCDAIRSLALLIAIGTLQTGCGSESETRGTLRDGLNWVVSEPGTRLDGVYLAEDRALFFELRRGGPMESVPVGETPPPMIDGRLVDGDGRVLMWQIAADDFIDPSWGTVADIYDDSPELVEQRAAALASADLHATVGRALLADLVAAPIPDGNLEEAHALAVMLRSFTSVEDTTVTADTGVTTYSANNYHKIQVHRGGCCCPGCEHSATKSLYKSCSTCATLVYVNRCNHGRCPGDSGMSLQCSSTWWGPRINLYPKGDHVCTTNYDATSTHGHNCNDDSEFQGRSVKHNAYQDPNDGYPCNNITPHATAPDCGF